LLTFVYGNNEEKNFNKNNFSDNFGDFAFVGTGAIFNGFNPWINALEEIDK